MAKELASYRRCQERIQQNWPVFQERRKERLTQQQRHGAAAEKVAENIIEDLFTLVLDWELADLNNQVDYADLLLSRLGIRYLLVEVKRPGALAWDRRAVEAALDQARRYADEQKVRCLAVSDGCMLYAADIAHGGLHDRVFISLDAQPPPEMLWWLSVHGIYRPRGDAQDAVLRLLPETPIQIVPPTDQTTGDLLHHKYKLAARCFAYVGNASDPKTWKLPYLLADGHPDVSRLPKAIQAVISNYRGTKVSGIPERDIPDVLTRLGWAAIRAGKMPFQAGETALAYRQLEGVLDQLDRLEEIQVEGNNSKD